jgi:hypothetical protein
LGTKIAFPDNPAFGRILGYIIRAFEDAILAANALVVEVTNGACVSVFFVSGNGTTIQAGWIRAMMAGRGDGLLVGRFLRYTLENSRVPPVFIGI